MNLDYLNGSSGIIYLLTKIYLDNDKIIPIEKLNTVMDKYLNHISDNYKTYMQIGLAHGLSGILMALFNIYIITKNNTTKKLIFDITEYENELINALFKKIVALGYLIPQKYHNDTRNMLP